MLACFIVLSVSRKDFADSVRAYLPCSMCAIPCDDCCCKVYSPHDWDTSCLDICNSGLSYSYLLPCSVGSRLPMPEMNGCCLVLTNFIPVRRPRSINQDSSTIALNTETVSVAALYPCYLVHSQLPKRNSGDNVPQTDAHRECFLM
jgi:hypothetical protein